MRQSLRVFATITLGTTAGCDGLSTIPSGSAPAWTISAESGTFGGEYDLQFGSWYKHPYLPDPYFIPKLFGHEPSSEIYLPPGDYELEIEVTGGTTTTPRYANHFNRPDMEGRFIGPGGYLQPNGWGQFSGSTTRRLLQVSVERVDSVNSQERRMKVWLGPPNDEATATGTVRVRGGARFRFSRNWNTAHFMSQEPTFETPNRFNWKTNQRGRLTARRLSTPSNLQVECTPDNTSSGAAVRGDPHTCRLSTKPAGGSITVNEWWFTGVDSRGRSYRFPDDGEPPEDGPTWGGRMVISGTVHVRAEVDGKSQEASTYININPRDWSGQQVEHQLGRIGLEGFNSIVADIRDRVPDFPTQDHHLGRFAARPIVLGSSDGVIDYVTDYGPNHRLAFFSRIPATLEMFVLVHPEMENRGRFYRQHPTHSVTNECVKSGFPRYVELILAHEGLPMNPRSHSGVHLREFQQRAGPAVENLVFPNDEINVLLGDAAARFTVANQAAAVANKEEVDTHYRVQFGCNFKWR